MSAQYGEIQELLRSRADLRSRLSLLPYDGTPEIKERGKEKYLYIRKRVAGKRMNYIICSSEMREKLARSEGHSMQ